MMVVILECEVKWVWGSTTRHKASGGDAIPDELFQILIDEFDKVLHSVCQQIWKTQQWPGKDQFSLQSQRQAMPKKAQSESESRSAVSNSLWPHGLYSPWNSPCQNTGLSSLYLLQGIFATQGLNPGHPHCRQILYSWATREAQEHSNYHSAVLISHASKVMLKILQARLQQYINWELPGVQAGFRKGGRTRDQIANICWITEEAREFGKTSILLHWLC